MTVGTYWSNERCINAISIQLKYGCVGVCMYGAGYAFRRALRYRAEIWHEGTGRAHEV